MEHKYKDHLGVTGTFTNSWTTGTLDPAGTGCLSGVAQGDGPQERDGRVYFIDQVFIRGQIQYTPAIAGTPELDIIVTLALIQDAQTNASLFNPDDVFLTVGAPAAPFSFRNLNFTQRFPYAKRKVLRLPTSQGNTTVVGATPTFVGGAIRVPFELSVYLKKPIKVQTSGTTDTVASIVDNSLHFIGVVNSTARGTTTITYNSRIRFRG